MLQIHFSNRLEALRSQLLLRLAHADAGVFTAQQVIVPGAAMRRHLSLAIAEDSGICANVHFSFLAQWLWQQVARVVPGVGAVSPFASAALAWRVHDAFCDAGFVAPHSRLSHYLHGADALMRFELASHVAALLEQYVTYRPDWLDAWRQGKRALPAPAGADDEAWQSALWLRVVARLSIGTLPPTQAFIDALRHGGTALARRAGLPPCVHVFALPGMAELHLQLLQQLSAWVEVHVYMLNPCREYWFELVDRRRLSHLAARGRAQGHEEGNRLLAGWGRQAQVQIEALLRTCGDGGADDAIFQASEGDNLLAQVQNALLDLQPLAPGSVLLDDGDRSIEVHVCHSLTRELEVLHDHLLALFTRLPELRPGDILVVTPRLDDAAPLIDAVFGTVPRERFIPYAIHGRARSAVNAPARALLDLLALAGSRCTATALFSVLQQPVVARRFGLDDEALALVHGWLRDASFHWALDAGHVADFDVPASGRHTLADALQRLFLGYALPSGQTLEPFAGHLGAGAAEGTQARALGCLWRFADALQQLHTTFGAPKAPAEWPAALSGVVDAFILAEGDQLDELRELRQAIRQLGDHLRDGAASAPLALAVVRSALQQRLDDDAARAGAAGGSLVFASMSSHRALPYAVVCAIGLNDGAFPSAQRPAEFDLLALHPRRGDRQRRSDERGLMLDLLLAARHSLYFSHTGRSVRDNSALPPSVLLAELLDTLVPAIAANPASADLLAAARRRLVVEHPLQAFAAEAFTVGGDQRLRSHDTELAAALRHARDLTCSLSRNAGQHWGEGRRVGGADSSKSSPHPNPFPASGAREEHKSAPAEDDDEPVPLSDDPRDEPPVREAVLPFFFEPLPPPEPAWREVSLDRLQSFFANPCRYLLQRRLGIELAHPADELHDDEPLLGDGRAHAALAQRLLPALRQGASADSIRRLAQAGAELPHGRIGEQQLQRQLHALTAFAQRLGELEHGPCLPPHTPLLPFDVDGEAWSLRAAFADLRAHGLVRWRYRKRYAVDYLQAWLQHLVLNADAPAGVAPHTHWLAADGEFTFSACADAPTHLRDLLRLYRRGLCEPLRFFPRCAWALAGEEKSPSAVRGVWGPAWDRSQRCEGDDPAYRLALRGIENPLDAHFEALAGAVFGPLLQHLDNRPSAP